MKRVTRGVYAAYVGIWVGFFAFAFSGCGGGSDGGNVPTDSNGNPLPTESHTTINCDESGNPQQCSNGTCTPVEAASAEEAASETSRRVLKWHFVAKIGDITIDGVVQCGAEININETTTTTETDTDVNSNNPSDDHSNQTTDSNNT